MRMRASGHAPLALALVTASAAVLALAGPASASPKAGKYSGRTSEKGAVTFVVAPNGKSVLDFSVQDGYNASCHFTGGFGGVKTFTLAIARMTLNQSGTFTGTQSQSNKPFRGTTVLVVKGRLSGTRATGTVDVPASRCGSGSPTPKAHFYLETFTASPA
jgi:hypothetical protein